MAESESPEEPSVLGPYWGHGDSALTRSDLVLIRSAISKSWDIPEQTASALIRRVQGALESENDRTAISAANVLLAIRKMNVEALAVVQGMLARAGEMQGVGASGQGLTKTEMVKLLREGDVGGAAHVEGGEDSGPS